MRLSPRDFAALQRVILELYEHRTLESFRAAAPKLILKLVPADHCAVNSYEVEPLTGRAKMVDCLESEPLLPRELVPAWEEHFWEHPFSGYFAAGGQPTALKLSDFFTLTQLRRRIEWELSCQPMAMDRVMALPVSGSGRLSGVSLCRRRRDFTERDRLLLNLLRPHYNQAFQNARLTSALLERCGKTVGDHALTPRELEVARWVGHGKTNPEIAIILRASVRTVEKHMERVLEKLGAENRTAVALTMAQANAGAGGSSQDGLAGGRNGPRPKGRPPPGA